MPEQVDRAREYQDYQTSDDEPDIPRILEPKLDRKGEISQRTVEQKKKQDNLVKADQRMKGEIRTDRE